ncbi:anhydro-N-acetylmuramic acid kinase [Lyngbya confervoides]|uniref:Anhydro-N-acetylmuramic acid kinase n=1 Tax=Lyngbya confervoides BDU141951 TaxID=1574623 RepID=A0ABD4T780_9CYAN|nr:anhydro-N-acetylmuramic acid kinase [Lyngbya confervoides]MCM1984115.1 anhydro-N-acetylmuramic acid kinase [Lyngbya confervoides BDU141951]
MPTPDPGLPFLQPDKTRVVGLMSGTSVDGIDAVLVDLSGSDQDLTVDLIASQTFAYAPSLRRQILALCQGERISLANLAQLDDNIARAFAEAALAVQSGKDPAILIGSHGQTVFHRPAAANTLGYSLQLGRGDLIAQITQTPTVCNFRLADIAAQGHGAPLVPRVDVCLLSDRHQSRCVQNLGGMGNTTYLPALDRVQSLGEGVLGWDTGPGNILLDLAVTRLTQGQLSYDANGQWAAQGKICHPLVHQWLQDPYFEISPPKSTGREYFGPAFLDQCFQAAAPYNLTPADLLATLTDFTAQSVAQEYRRFLPHPPGAVLLCGGGSQNTYLRQRLAIALNPTPVGITTDYGLDAKAKESIAFAILAYWHQLGLPGNLPRVTGAQRDCVLGLAYGVHR